MTEETKMAETPMEGDVKIPTVEPESDNSAESPNETNEGNGNEIEKVDDDKLPFHEHPRWKERESEWNQKFNDQETRHFKEIDELRGLINKAGDKNPPAGEAKTPIPAWFTGGQQVEETPELRALWDGYLEHQKGLYNGFKEDAVKSIDERTNKQEAARKEAIDYLDSQVAVIEKDKALNPTGAKVDRQQLVNVAEELSLVDVNGKWNYKAAWMILQSRNSAKPAEETPKETPKDERKALAGATTTKPGGDTKKPKNFKTSDDFKTNRPW